MTEVTAEMIERGPGADARLSAERRRLALPLLGQEQESDAWLPLHLKA